MSPIASFNATVKNELCRLPVPEAHCAVAEMYGMFLLGNTFTAAELKILTAHSGFAARLPSLLRTAFRIDAVLRRPAQGRAYILSIRNPEEIRRIRAAFGYGAENTVSLHLNNAILERDCCQKSFWRGAFLSGGTMTNPEKDYRMELVTPHRHLARELPALLREQDLRLRCTERSGVQVLYLKQSEAAIDFLTMCGAGVSAMTVIHHKIEKELRNNANRRVNCDSHNLDKTVAATERQRIAIQSLESGGTLDTLPETLRTAALARLEHPEDSLSQLAERLNLTKSCLNHRLRKLSALAEE